MNQYSVAMSVRKTPKADMRKTYPLFVEIGLVFALSIVIFAFRLNVTVEDSFDNVISEQEVVQMEDIQQTEQIEKPPAPPRPAIPVEVPNDEILENDELDLDVFLDLDAVSELPPPPLPTPEEEIPEPEIFVVVEQMPELIGGLAGLQKKIHYPQFAQDAGIEGRVYLQFIVDEEGIVTDPVVLRGIHPLCDDEALRAIRTARFTPGMQRGRAVKVKMALPVIFRGRR